MYIHRIWNLAKVCLSTPFLTQILKLIHIIFIPLVGSINILLNSHQLNLLPSPKPNLTTNLVSCSLKIKITLLHLCICCIFSNIQKSRTTQREHWEHWNICCCVILCWIWYVCVSCFNLHLPLSCYLIAGCMLYKLTGLFSWQLEDMTFVIHPPGDPVHAAEGQSMRAIRRAHRHWNLADFEMAWATTRTAGLFFLIFAIVYSSNYYIYIELFLDLTIRSHLTTSYNTLLKQISDCEAPLSCWDCTHHSEGGWGQQAIESLCWHLLCSSGAIEYMY